MSLRRGSSVLTGGAFERFFCPEGREFEEANLQKFKYPGLGGGCCTFELIGTLTFCCHWGRISNTGMCLYGLVSNAAVVTNVNNTILIFKFPFFIAGAAKISATMANPLPKPPLSLQARNSLLMPRQCLTGRDSHN